MKKVGIVLLVALSLLIFVSCTKNEVQEEKVGTDTITVKDTVVSDDSQVTAQKALNIGYVTNSLAADSNARAYNAFEKVAKEKGWKVNLTDAQGNIVKMNEGIMNYVGMKVDAIIIACAEVEPLEGAYDAAKAAGIPVFSIDTGLDKNGAILVNVTSSSYTMGAEVATQVVDRLHGEGNVVIMQMPTIKPHRNRIEAAKGVFNSVDNQGINIIEEEALTAANWEKNSYDTMNTWLIKYGDKIDAVIASADPIAWRSTQAIIDSGFTKDDMFLMTIDGTEQAYDMIRDGAPLTGVCAQNFSGWADKTADIIDKILVQGKLPEEVIPSSKIVYVEYKWIDETNVPDKGHTSDEELFN